MNSVERDITPDVLRGLALLGILFVNIPLMGISSGTGAHDQWVQPLVNSVFAFLIFTIFQAKFYLLFSFLFGYSSHYIMKNDKSNRRRWIKRCLTLIVFGAFHGAFLWHGEIVFIYGVLGLLLIPFFFRTDRTIKIWTRVIYIFIGSIFILFSSLLVVVDRLGFEAGAFESSSALKLDQILLSGTFLESVQTRPSLWLETLGFLLFFQGLLAFAAFLFGFRLSKTKFLSTQTSDETISKMIKYGLYLGLPIQIVIGFFYITNEISSTPSDALYLAATLMGATFAPLLSMGYVGLVMKLIKQKPALVSWVKPAGKMSLSVYFTQSLITLMIFGPWGLGLFQKVQVWQIFFLTILIWLFQVYLATVWFKRFKQGPLEAGVAFLTKNR